MAQLRVPFVTHPYQGPPSDDASDDGRVVAMNGEYDPSTVTTLCDMLSASIAADDADLIIDASGVTFLDAATINVIVRAQRSLTDYSRSLIVRSPSQCVRRILGICELDDLIEAPSHRRSPVDPVGAGALGPWTAVPPTSPNEHPSSVSPDRTPSRVSASEDSGTKNERQPASIGRPAARTEEPRVAPTSVRH